MDVFAKWVNEGFISENAYKVLSQEYSKDDPSLIDTNKQVMKISVAISTYNRLDSLIRLLKSVNLQDYKNVEVIVVDDHSTENHENSVNSCASEFSFTDFKYFRNETNMGAGYSKRRAYLECTGDIIIFSDDDDYYIDYTYFSQIVDLYSKDPKCSMTIAPTISFFEKGNEYDLQKLNVPDMISNIEYFNGFMTEYSKPNSMFTMSMRAASIATINYSELKYFGDTPLYLFGLLVPGHVRVLRTAVGIYYMNGKNMTFNVKSDFILGNLEAKYDIYQRALKAGIINDSDHWKYTQLSITASHYLSCNTMVKPEDVEVWNWMKKHLNARDYYRFVISVIITRKKLNKKIDLRSIPLL